jgi:protoheme IX farnesyltransferase
MPRMRTYANLTLAAAAVGSVLIVLGGAVCFMEAAKAIPDWPASFGGIAPPAEPGAFVEYLHRVAAAIVAGLVIAAAVIGLRRYRSHPWLSIPPAVAVALLGLVSTVGALVVLTTVSPALAALDLASALMVLALMVTSTLVARRLRRNPGHRGRLAFRDPFSRLTLAAGAALYVVLATGLSVGNPAPGNCLGLPLWGGFSLTPGRQGWLAVSHLLLSGVAAALVVAVVVMAWLKRRAETVSLCLASGVGALLFGLLLTGELAAARGFPWSLMAIRVCSAAVLWGVLVALAVWEGLRATAPATERAGGAPPSSGGIRRARDLASTTRPLVTGLLLVTGYAGMLSAGGGVPPLWLTFRTLLALALAAGGAQAINQYMDRDMDAAMTRTAGRPLPAGRLAPAEALAWGLTLCIGSLYLMGTLVGSLAAAATALGIGWYLLVYTGLLKRRSPQSIVIGGVAGALMPIVGCVAASGRLSVTAILLSLIVFLWTPPHFWSLAVLRVQDYSKAGVPVLPAIRGEASARTRILLYSAVLVAATVGLSLLGAARSLFIVAAIALGGFLLYRAWGMRRGGELAAARMYRYSSVYLALLLVALAADQLI